MNKIKVFLSKDSRKIEYSVVIGRNLLEIISELYNFSSYSNVFIILDQNIVALKEKLIGTLPKEHFFFTLKSGEIEKKIKTIENIWTSMQKANIDRNSIVINIGGGVLTDLGGFAASTYMRGLPFINIPTTLLSQVDASVGGKTGINFAKIKNLIGTFNQPEMVIIDTETLVSLPQREFLSGFAEIIKHGLIKSRDYFNRVTSKKPLDFDNNELLDVISKSIQIKADIVKSDPDEKNLRKTLNFGHTVGHAIEALSYSANMPLLHGEAISVGMIAEAKISQLAGLLTAAQFVEIKNALISADLPIEVSGYDREAVYEKMKFDKKNSNSKINFTLLNGIGNAVINQNVSAKVLNEALESVLIVK